MGNLALNGIVRFCSLPLHRSNSLSSVYNASCCFNSLNLCDLITDCCISRIHRISSRAYSPVLKRPFGSSPRVPVLKFFTALSTSAVNRISFLKSLYFWGSKIFVDEIIEESIRSPVSFGFQTHFFKIST